MAGLEVGVWAGNVLSGIGMFPQGFDLFVSPKTLLKARKRDWKVATAKKSWKRKGGDSWRACASLSSV